MRRMGAGQVTFADVMTALGQIEDNNSALWYIAIGVDHWTKFACSGYQIASGPKLGD